MERRNFIKTTGLSAAGISLAGTGFAGSVLSSKSVKRPICAFTKCLQFLNFDQIAEVLARLGFDGADITLRPGGQIEPENTKSELPKAVKTMEKAGVGIPMMVTSIVDSDDKLSVETLKIAADSGIKYYRMGWLGYDFSKSIQQNLDTYKTQFEKLARLNEKLGIHGGYQNHSGLHVGAPVWDLYELLKDVDPKYLGVQYDIRHATTEGGYSWLLGMKRIEPWIRTICIKDFVWSKNEKGEWKHENVMLGEGMVKFDEFLKEYATLKIEAPISMHFEYDLGGAENGKKEITMEPEKIYNMMKTDLDWLRKRLSKKSNRTIMINSFTRREFLRTTGVAGAATFAGLHSTKAFGFNDSVKKITITGVSSNFEREPLIRPFGFKGGYMTEIWQTMSYLESGSGLHDIGLCTQSVLWSDAQVFDRHSESGGNAIMYAITERALQIVKGQSFTSPIEILDHILPEVYEFGKKITSNPRLRKTFALNALVGLDNAVWLLYAKENGYKNFDEMIPMAYQPALSYRHAEAAAIPLMAYNIPISEIKAVVDDGYFFMKIKIGQPGTQEEMLEKDKARLSAIHETIGKVRTRHTEDGKLPYYFDANGRYEKKETLLKLIDHAKKIGAFEQISIIEEPFPEELEIDVADIPVRLAADESAHTDEDAIKRIQMGYGAIALKAIAKTLSMTMKIAQAAHVRNVPCFCADLTVNPILVEWNKNIAARLKPFPGMGSLGLIESNGHQNYKNWNKMMSYHPRNDGVWVQAKNGVYELNDEFYKTGGGIFDLSEHYEAMFKH